MEHNLLTISGSVMKYCFEIKSLGYCQDTGWKMLHLKERCVDGYQSYVLQRLGGRQLKIVVFGQVYRRLRLHHKKKLLQLVMYVYIVH